MGPIKIIVSASSANFWWGVYGLTEKAGWEDLSLFYDTGERIGGVCLQSKGYMRDCLPELKNDPSEIVFVKAIEIYLVDNKCHYWYYYDDKGSKDFYEVPYEAPQNSAGVKPRFIDIWHPDEDIDLKTIENAVAEFAKTFLKKESCIVEFEDIESIADSVKSFLEHQHFFGKKNTIDIVFSDKVVLELSQHWELPKEQVIEKLKQSI